MKKFVVPILALVMLAPLSSFQVMLENNPNRTIQSETIIKKFTFELKDPSLRSKVESAFSDRTKFLKVQINSKQVFVFTKSEFSYRDMEDILNSIGNQTKTLTEESMTKTEFYQNYGK